MKSGIGKQLVWIVPVAVLVLLIVLGTAVVMLTKDTAVPERFQPEQSGMEVADRLVAGAVAGETVKLSAPELARCVTGMMKMKLTEGDVSIDCVYADVTGEDRIDFCFLVEIGGAKRMLTASVNMVADEKDGSVIGMKLNVEKLWLGKLPLPTAAVMKLASGYVAELLPEGISVSGTEILFSLEEFAGMVEEFKVTDDGVQIQVKSYAESMMAKLAKQWNLSEDSFIMKLIMGFVQEQFSGKVESVADAEAMLKQWEDKSDMALIGQYIEPMVTEAREKLEMLKEMTGYAVA